jgi:hypothetical protein
MKVAMINFDRCRHADISQFISLNVSFLGVPRAHGIEFVWCHPPRCDVISLRRND